MFYKCIKVNLNKSNVLLDLLVWIRLLPAVDLKYIELVSKTYVKQTQNQNNKTQN